MAPAPAQVAAVPLVGEPAHDRVTVPATDLPSCEFGQYPVQRSIAQVPEIRGVVTGRTPRFPAECLRMFGPRWLRTMILRSPHRLLDLLYWVV